MRATFIKILANYTSEESLINAVYDKDNLSDFFLKEVSGAGKAWNDRGFFYWIYRVSDAALWAKWLYALTHKASINNIVSGLSDILIGCLDVDI